MHRAFNEFFKDCNTVRKIILTTGGTGGHIFPALAVADCLQKNWPDICLLFVGSQYGPEKRIVGLANIAFEGLPVRGILGRGIKSILALFMMLWSFIKALNIIRKFKPDAVIGFGGYASFAPMLAANIFKIPTILHEQNAIAGSSNKFLSKRVKKVCLSLPNTRGFLVEKCVLTGNPVRESIENLGTNIKINNTKHLLILGGSQGAHALNMFLPTILPILKNEGIEVRHQTGLKDKEITSKAYEDVGYSKNDVVAFIDNISESYAWADIVLCRSGASTVAELCAAALPSILIPFPSAIHDHQNKNAEVLEQNGAAIRIQESELLSKDIAKIIIDLFKDREKLIAMSKAARKLAPLGAAKNVSNVLLDIINNNQ